MQFHTLEHVPVSSLAEVFNRSFADYFVPLQIDEAALHHKIYTERIDLSLSVGAFEDNKPVGFILNGVDTVNGITKVYNAGTGVVPEHRGKHVTQEMYRYILPILKQHGASKSTLEVICENERAIKAYEQVGYTITRKLVGFKGTIEVHQSVTDVIIKPINNPDWDMLHSMGGIKPTWQHDTQTILRAGDSNITLGIYKHDVLCGYLNFNVVRMRVFQFAIAEQYRRQGLGTMLFQYLAEHYSQPVSIINIDENAADCIGFLNSLHLPHFINQYEMELIIK